ncbi:unnamed protein product [Psylliodes chrysocephalus]|uniref:BESS domain-containing protein n=1 Tax=Psylliodes chrysocephalus TaxID=3402493 RepID=A0A9P0CQB1_9CUCU|nr:unnamed protein product [Psylliodes chrysocephala]
MPQDMLASTSAHDDIMVLSSRNITSQTLESETQVNKGKKRQPPTKLTNDNNKTKESKATPNNVTPSTNANIDKALEKLDEISSRAHASLANQNREDHLDHFGKYILSMLRNVSPRKSLSLQKDIISLLFEAQMSPPSLSMTSTTEDDSCSDYPGRPPSSDTNVSTSFMPASPLPSCAWSLEDFDYLPTRL